MASCVSWRLHLLVFLVAVNWIAGESDGHGDDRSRTEATSFILDQPKEVVRTDAGVIKVLPRREQEDVLGLMDYGLAFTTLEPKALLLPHYLDADVVLYVQQGKARIGWEEGQQHQTRDLQQGDIYSLPGGTVHYILNKDADLRLEILSLIDARHSISRGHVQRFYVAGGWDPVTIHSGFDADLLAAAFKVDKVDLGDLLNAQTKGPMVFTSTKEVGWDGGKWQTWMKEKLDDLCHLLTASNEPKPFNLLQKRPDFQNANGWSSTVDANAFPLLKHVDVGLFAVSLKAGSILAPHWNPRATEIGLVTKGEGYVHIAFPNGTKALDKRVSEGTVFIVPRYFPVSQVATSDGTFEFVGFTTCGGENKPQFLAGGNSVLNSLVQEDDDVLAAAFDLSKKRLHYLLGAQEDSVILPTSSEEAKYQPFASVLDAITTRSFDLGLWKKDEKM